MKEYLVSPGSPVSPQDAQKVGEFLETLSDDGLVTIDVLMDNAMHPALVKYFEWDNEVAANNWRRNQARNIVNHMLVKYITPEGQEKITKAFISITVTVMKKDEIIPIKYYAHVKEMSNPDTRKAILEEALDRFRSLRKRYRGIKELAELFEAIDNFSIEVEAV